MAATPGEAGPGGFFWRTVAFLAPLAMLAVYGIVLYRTAWLSDDAYITYRTVDNLVNGYGLRWNTAERVQAYTHPLWMFLNAGVYFYMRDMFLTGVLVSCGVSLLAVTVLVSRLAASAFTACMALAFLLISRSFVDYSTSGLENPLTHLLLAVFLCVYLRPIWTMRGLFLMSLICAGGMLNRVDSLLLYLPALAYAWSAERNWRATLAMALGFVPLVLWELFSLIYYGFPVPNTAFAKLGTGIPSAEQAVQGGYYFQNALWMDPPILVLMLMFTIFAVWARGAKYLPLAMGVLLYLLYVVKIGGDFMSGRFFTAPYFLAVVMFSTVAAHRRLGMWTAALAVALLTALVHPQLPFLTGADYGVDTRGFKDAHGIGDERKFYFQSSSLINDGGMVDMPTHPFARRGQTYRALDKPHVKVHGSVGFRGFFAGPKTHIIDFYALTDPLLSHLPAKYAPDVRIGHFVRHLPEGYVESVISGTNRIEDPALAKYYDAIRLVTEAPLWSTQRLEGIWHLNTGQLDYLLDRDRYRFPHVKRVPYQLVSEPKASRMPWNAEGNIIKRPEDVGISVLLDRPWRAGGLEVSADWNDPYIVLFMNGDDVVGETGFGPGPAPHEGLAIYKMRVPIRAWHAGYDSIKLLPQGQDPWSSVGHVRPIH